MHAEAKNYVARISRVHDLGYKQMLGLEFGAKNVNGSARANFRNTSFVGVDRLPGKNVNVVEDAADYEGKAYFDLVLCTEVLEHAANAEEILVSAWRALKPGGYLIATMAGEGRDAHGVDGNDVGDEFYRNVTLFELAGWLAEGWEEVSIEENTKSHDIYVTARKPWQ